MEQDEIIQIPINGTLDLHTFSPKDVKDLVPEYLEECKKFGITEVRIIHGKGIGVLREIVHSILDKHSDVISYEYGRSWGDTVAVLRKPEV
ncbi:DNA mismatch repair protein MutS [Candidatus Poribacteria bacterium]|nr:DNA mismatch repair protein MutS [Candidatus Poribacteria bacterium]